jgi:hypothetical protein
MESTATDHRPPQAPEPLTDVYRRLVGIHAALTERPTIDADVRKWTIRELMDVLHYIESARKQP